MKKILKLILNNLRRYSKMPIINVDYINPENSNNSQCSNNNKNYEEAVRTLNTLQSNAVTLEKARLHRGLKQLGIPETVELARRAGVTMDRLDTLSVIHISGTKGKGSTCAFIESILHQHGYSTGFFCSPHLVEVRERIRINGKSISRVMFSDYFWKCYTAFTTTKHDNDSSMPTYFRFLTVMAFDLFIEQKVDVAIIEVGIGGEYDSTNIIRSPAVVGITTLDYDHIQLLGPTIEQIAWHKAGILKKGTPAFTVAQVPSALEVIRSRAADIGCPLRMVPHLSDYSTTSDHMHLGISGEKQIINLSLALQCCDAWLHPDKYSSTTKECSTPQVQMARPFVISDTLIKGIERCTWPGRCQIVDVFNTKFYLDGAHTPLSIQACIKWFKDTRKKDKRNDCINILMFNCVGDRASTSLLPYFKNCDIDLAIFCPNIVTSYSKTADQTNYTIALDKTLEICEHNGNIWKESMTGDSMVLNSIGDSIRYIDTTYGMNKDTEINVLCSGSLHLIGGILNILQNEYQIENIV